MKRKYYKFTDKYSKYLEQLHRKFALPDMKNRYYRNNSVNMSNAISCNGKEFSRRIIQVYLML